MVTLRVNSALVAFALLAVQSHALPSNHTEELVARQSQSQYTYVNLAVNTGNPVHRASGILYGMPKNPNQIPDNIYRGMGFNFLSDGGAQDPQYSGWIWGGYTGRMAGIVTRYRKARSLNARYLLKMSDIWGADGTQGSSAIWPGDNNNWAEYDRFLTQFTNDLRANGMGDALILIWNEPDYPLFWDKGIDRYLQMWHRTARHIRTALPGQKIAGPSTVAQPDNNNAWWSRLLNECRTQSTCPDVYTWHHLSGSGDPNHDLSVSQPRMVQMLQSRGLPVGEFIIDEYAVANEQTPAGSAWWIAGFERWNMNGLRANWANGWQLLDFMAALLGKSNNNDQTGGGYYPNGEYQVYRYYTEQMSGYRVQTTRSSDGKLDSYSVVGNRIVRTLVGARLVTGTYMLEFQNLNALGLPASGNISVRTQEFAWGGVRGRVDGTRDLGVYTHSYSGNVLRFPIYQTSTSVTWAFEFGF